MYEQEHEYLKPFFSLFCSSWKERSFSLGTSIASEKVSQLGKNSSYEMLNYDDPMEVIEYREIYLLLYLGFWQASVGIRVKTFEGVK